ncbi:MULTISPECIES: AbrB/MazE/SpoVT family DNA-binding domain-containing protein [unclassified Pseudomonas]|uniref:AbrB/MazE/SpoVT family DNA-binding domain-containing protein n=1 Tax=unclassified Pseudomonas TaxID=196821 RepID=UPI000C88AD15|nr:MULTISPECIES: AbrB/MazE/SpoVT family DNA-binding domain-containing protein [unclassified Pseudomonas]PNA00488.1 PbsX family transcriptional regulator [Pseudomonas sp. FW305-42]PNA25336.1 PbsX family transcriptional regulator [Pseudomonas sp. MPR-R1B]PNB25911.1 PbsX family transcriptional regulator [Pseudomonas sp. DP16D-E2]PNB43727.1 PbsX family transcriptional regulator [Pseudomonas sp. FW305-17]PNB62457.1 PbsX family transcriptional regulator [Pseudomonas sp. GW531-E2]
MYLPWEILMQIKIQQWGNSAAIRIPSTVLKQMRLEVGSTLSLDTAGESMVLKPVRSKPKYTLEELMAQCDLNAPEPEDMAAWNMMRPTGREV